MLINSFLCAPPRLLRVSAVSLYGELTLLREDAARLIRARRVNRRATLFDVADDAVLVYDERGARAVAAFFVEDAVVAHGRAFEIAEQGKGDLDVFGEARIGGRAVNADA